jgi:glucose-1-phosphate thymidylyltransferase
MKGIILAGGSGSRLAPCTNAISKQLLPIHDKPMVFYSLSILFLAKIKDILIISTPDHIDLYKKILGDGSKYGASFTYVVQENPGGIAQAFILGESFIGNQRVALILGDNIFYGSGLSSRLEEAKQSSNAVIFTYSVNDPRSYGVLKYDEIGRPYSIIEKPIEPPSSDAVTGLYFYESSVVNIAKSLKPSNREELEITDINNEYMKEGKLDVIKLGKGFAWLDTGTYESLNEASRFIEIIENRQGNKVGCLEEIALNNEWITKNDVFQIGLSIKNSSYGNYLIKISQDEN